MKKRSTVMIFLLVLSIFIETSPQILNVRKALADDYGNTEAVLPLEVLGTASNTSSGLSPAQIKAVYNLPSNGGNGTVAIVDSYDDPAILNDSNIFSNQFGLPILNGTNFEIHMMNSTIGTDSGWAEETSLDVEWVHAIAPEAKILLVEATNKSITNLLAAVDYARSRSDVVAVSMSWGWSELAIDPIFYDSHFSNNSISFFAASGDNCSLLYPASSPNVVGVGGTTLNFNGSSFLSETVWYEGLVGGYPRGTGGGVSLFESEPSYQVSYGVQGTNGYRGVPDVSFDAGSGVSVYDSIPGPYGQYWLDLGGTSFGAPSWAAIYSDGLTASNSRLYSIASSVNYTSDFRDIINGTNGNYNASTGYDFVTGLGSPLATTFHPPPDNAVLSGPQTVARDIWYTYTTNAVNDPDGGQIRYHLNVTGPGTPYQNTTIWVNSGTAMTWKGMWEPTDNTGVWLFQTWVEDSYEMLSNMTSITVNLVDPVSAMKTNCSGFFYVPTVATGGSLKIEEFYTGDINGTGDQYGATSPYPSLGWWPDGKVDGKDVARISLKFGLAEGNAGWEYMADVYPDRKIDGKDIAVPKMYFGDSGVYTSYLSNLGITVTFNGGTPITPDANGFVSIPQNATNFIVEQNSNPIGALITFWNTTVT